MQLAMIEVIDLEDDDDSQPPSQIELTQQQKSRSARNKEIALARLQARQIRDTGSWRSPLQFCTTQEHSKSSVEDLGTPPLYDRPWDRFRFIHGGGTQQVKKRDHPTFDEVPVLRRKLNSHQTDFTETVSPGEKTMELSEQQLQVLKAIHQGKSVFMTGSAGTGKSHLLKVAIRDLRRMYGGDNVFVTASTGLAASELGGTTINAFAGVGLGKESGQKLFSKVLDRKDASARWDRAKAVVIDEISMINGEFFDKLAYVGGKMKSVNLTVGPQRGCKKEGAQEKPWGGIQLVVTGDFFQLPPVKPPNPRKVYAFQAECWDSCFDMQVELTQVFRQADSVFVDMLNEIRRGYCSDDTAQVLQSCDGRQCLENSLGVMYTRLYPHLKDVRTENERALMALGTPSVVFKAKDELRTPNWLGQLNEAVPASLSLCIGAQVMLTKNVDTKLGLVNGARGVVVGFSNADDPACAIAQDTHCIPRGFWPIVVFACEEGLKRIVGPQVWSIMDGQFELASRSQVPLALAWALSVHKCQGMTLDRVETNLVNAFDHGQVYVALSRVKSLNGLRLTGFIPSKIKAHPLVVNFYKQLGQCQQQPGF